MVSHAMVSHALVSHALIEACLAERDRQLPADVPIRVMVLLFGQMKGWRRE